eukprot:7387440-Prymnesium_polylepis.2
MATAPLDRAADGAALPQPTGCERASDTIYVTHWNDSSKSKDVAIASTCLFGNTYETTIGRKLKAEDVKTQPELGSVGDKIQRSTTRTAKTYNEYYNAVDTSDMDWEKVRRAYSLDPTYSHCMTRARTQM